MFVCFINIHHIQKMSSIFLALWIPVPLCRLLITDNFWYCVKSSTLLKGWFKWYMTHGIINVQYNVAHTE